MAPPVLPKGRETPKFEASRLEEGRRDATESESAGRTEGLTGAVPGEGIDLAEGSSPEDLSLREKWDDLTTTSPDASRRQASIFVTKSFGELRALSEFLFGAGRTEGPILATFRLKAEEILARVPEEKSADAESEIAAAFDRVRDAEDKDIGKVLGPELRRIESQYVPAALRAKKPTKEELKEAKDSRRERDAMELLAEALPEDWPGIAEELDSFRSFNGSAKKIRDKVFEAAGRVEKNDPIGAYNTLRGLMFEISRNKKFAQNLGVNPGEAQADPAEPVTYHGFKRDADGVKLVQKSSSVDNDTFVLNGTGLILETKSYPRKNFGADENGNVDLQVLSQAAKYNEKVKSGRARAASIEVVGNVSTNFIFELYNRVPEVEVLYCFPLPSGEEIVFRLKEGGDGRPSLKRWPDLRSLPESEQVVVDGIRKLIQSGKILKDDVLQNNFLKLEDIGEDSPHYERFKNAAREDGSIDPVKIEDLGAYKEWEQRLYGKRLKYFEEKSHTEPLRRSSDHLKSPVTPEAVDLYIAEAEATIAVGPEHTRKQYSVAAADRPKVRAEFERRLKAIQEHESGRMDSAREQDRQVERAAMGYEGPEEGYVLDVAHVYMDVVKGLKEEAKAQGGKKGKETLSLGMTEPLPARSYDLVDSIKTGDEILEYLLSPDNQFAKDNHFVRVVFPEAVDPDVGEQVLNAKIFDVTDPKAREKLETDMHRRNMGRLKTLKEDASFQGQVSRHKTEIRKAEGELQGIRNERDRKFAEIDGNAAIPNPMKGKEKGKVSREYEAKIRVAEENLLNAHKDALGEARSRQVFEYTESEWSSDEVKFIYTIDAEGVLRMVQEDLKPGSERPAHSQLAGGLNVYAAGQVWISGKPVIGEDGISRIKVNVIDDGSGHYRPGTFDMLPYAQSVFEDAGFDVSTAEPKHAPLPFVPLADNFDEPVQPWTRQEGQ